MKKSPMAKEMGEMEDCDGDAAMDKPKKKKKKGKKANPFAEKEKYYASKGLKFEK